MAGENLHEEHRARMKARVAPTSFIVWTVNLRANTLSLIVLFINTKEMKSIRAMNTPSTIEIRLRLELRASTRDF